MNKQVQFFGKMFITTLVVALIRAACNSIFNFINGALDIALVASVIITSIVFLGVMLNSRREQ